MVLLVNEGVLLPVLMPLAPAATLAERFPEALQGVFEALGVVPAFIERARVGLYFFTTQFLRQYFNNWLLHGHISYAMLTY